MIYYYLLPLTTAYYHLLLLTTTYHHSPGDHPVGSAAPTAIGTCEWAVDEAVRYLVITPRGEYGTCEWAVDEAVRHIRYLVITPAL